MHAHGGELAGSRSWRNLSCVLLAPSAHRRLRSSRELVLRSRGFLTSQKRRSRDRVSRRIARDGIADDAEPRPTASDDRKAICGGSYGARVRPASAELPPT